MSEHKLSHGWVGRLAGALMGLALLATAGGLFYVGFVAWRAGDFQGGGGSVPSGTPLVVFAFGMAGGGLFQLKRVIVPIRDEHDRPEVVSWD